MKFNKSNLHFIILGIISTCFLAICIGISIPYAYSPLNGEISQPINENWTVTIAETGESELLTLPTNYYDIQPNQTAVLKHKLPTEFKMGATLLLRTSQQSIKVYMNDVELYKYPSDDKTPPFGKTMGSAWHFVRLPQNYPDQQLTIEVSSPYKSYSTVLNEVAFGTKASHVFKLLGTYLLGTIIGIVLMIAGLIFVITYFFMYKLSGKRSDILYLAIFSILCGIWIISEGRLLQIVYNNPFFNYMLSFLSLYFITIPLCFFVLQNNAITEKRAIHLLLCAHFIIVLACILLQLSSLVDFIDSVPIFHLLMLIEACYMVFISYKHRKQSKSLRVFLASFLIVSLTAILDIISYYGANNHLATGTFTQFGILIFTVTIIINAGKEYVQFSHSAAVTQAFKKLAYTDIMTGLKNRTAFQECLDEIETKTEFLDTVSIAIGDVDGLKQINDTYGHKSGDDVIKKAADVLQFAFSKLGDVYRIGGDEFVVIMFSATTEQCDEALSRLEEEVEQYNETNGVLDFSIAVGIKHYEPGVDTNITDLFNRADSDMYNTKATKKLERFKAEFGQK